LQVILRVLTHAELTMMWKQVRRAHLSLMFACAQKQNAGFDETTEQYRPW
jgi:hypothetical protein